MEIETHTMEFGRPCPSAKCVWDFVVCMHACRGGREGGEMAQLRVSEGARERGGTHVCRLNFPLLAFL